MGMEEEIRRGGEYRQPRINMLHLLYRRLVQDWLSARSDSHCVTLGINILEPSYCIILMQASVANVKRKTRSTNVGLLWGKCFLN